MSVDNKPPRIESLDQFRGYSVAGMFLVNFLGGLAITHHVLRHNNTHFSYADSIMPSFIFTCGFSYRMSFLKRLAKPQATGRQIQSRFVARSLGLILLSLMLFGFNSSLSSWAEATPERLLRIGAELLKANIWEVLAIIGAVQILLLPIVAAPARARVAVLVLCAIVHTVISWSFNYDFVYGKPNWMDSYVFGAEGKRAWDGGLFGLISWAEIMLLGTLAFDLMQGRLLTSAGRLLAIGTVLMLFGYGLSCLTRLYDRDGISPANGGAADASPVIPDFSQLAGRQWQSLLAEPPFVPPPPVEQRAMNYWMMDKRVVTQSFTLFSGGAAMALYAIFVLVCDIGRFNLGIFRTFGQNPLAAYAVHYLVMKSILSLVPKDSPLAWCLVGLSVSFGITYMFVSFLERRGLYLRL